jgi:hypothetical protein
MVIAEGVATDSKNHFLDEVEWMKAMVFLCATCAKKRIWSIDCNLISRFPPQCDTSILTLR